MPRLELVLSGYKAVWLLTMFDLPVDTRNARKRYAEFRKTLLKQGFSMLQYSVYGRFCASEESAQTHRNRVRAALPPEGYVRLLMVTDHQFAKMESYVGKADREPEKGPLQLALF